MISNIDEDNVKFIHDSNRKSQMMPKGFKQVPWDESPCIPKIWLHTTRFLASKQIHAQRCYPLTIWPTLSLFAF